MAQELNLSAYQDMFRSDPEGFERLCQARRHEAVSSHTCANGQKVVCVQGRKLHSGRDPELEAKRFTRTASVEGKTTVLLLGYASGYVAHALARSATAQVLVYEPSLSILLESLTHLPPQSEIQIITSAEALREYLLSRQILNQNLSVIAWPASARIQTVPFEQARKVVLQSVKHAQLSHNTRGVRSKGWVSNYIKNLPQFADHPNLNTYRNRFEGYPAIVCSAGPSLNKNAPLLKKLQGKCLIISVNTAAKALAQMGVQAHIIVSVESLNIVSQLEDIPWLSECTGFLDVTGGQEVFDLPFRSIVATSLECGPTTKFSDRLSPGQTFGSGYSVSHTAMAIASHLGCSGIVLIGQNLAYDDGQAYATGTVFEDIRVSRENGRTIFHNCESKLKITQASPNVIRGNKSQTVGAGAVRLPAWGNPTKLVDTSVAYALFAEWFAEASQGLTKRGIWHINATEGGLHIKNWEERTLADTIEHYKLDEAPQSADAHVETLLQTLSQAPGLGTSYVLEALDREKRQICEIAQSLEELRERVDHDPDGDIRLSCDRSKVVFDIWDAVRVQVKACPLLEAQLTSPLQAMLDRQDLNTFNLAVTIEAEIKELLTRIDPILETLKARVTQTKAAS